jgi:hypothetical protein
VKSFVSWLETSLDRAAAEHPSPGRVALHRMNRAEYANAVERILGLHVDAMRVRFFPLTTSATASTILPAS